MTDWLVLSNAVTAVHFDGARDKLWTNRLLTLRKHNGSPAVTDSQTA